MIGNFDTLFLAGERADPDTIKWFETLSNSPVIDHWWQTETSWAITSSCTGIEKFPLNTVLLLSQCQDMILKF